LIYRIEHTDASRADLRDIALYLRANAGPAVAEKITARILDKIESLQNKPKRQRLRVGLARDLRSVSSGNYMIFYRVRNDVVGVARILHGSRNISARLFPPEPP
jgi:toxin ParE1/3/4